MRLNVNIDIACPRAQSCCGRRGKCRISRQDSVCADRGQPRGTIVGSAPKYRDILSETGQSGMCIATNTNDAPLLR